VDDVASGLPDLAAVRQLLAQQQPDAGGLARTRHPDEEDELPLSISIDTSRNATVEPL